MFSGCPSDFASVRDRFSFNDNLRMAEGVQVKLGTSMYNDELIILWGKEVRGPER